MITKDGRVVGYADDYREALKSAKAIGGKVAPIEGKEKHQLTQKRSSLPIAGERKTIPFTVTLPKSDEAIIIILQPIDTGLLAFKIKKALERDWEIWESGYGIAAHYSEDDTTMPLQYEQLRFKRRD